MGKRWSYGKGRGTSEPIGRGPSYFGTGTRGGVPLRQWRGREAGIGDAVWDLPFRSVLGAEAESLAGLGKVMSNEDRI